MTKKEVLRAVDRSIEHWLRDIVMQIEVEGKYRRDMHGGDNCPLCKKYLKEHLITSPLVYIFYCWGCPVWIMNTYRSCGFGTVWGEFNMSRTLENAKNMVATSVRARQHVEKNFPKGEQPC